MPLPASSTTLNGLMTVGSMNDMTCLTYGSRMLRFVDLAALRRRRRQVAAGNHVANVVDASVAAQRERTFAHELHAVVLLGIVRRGDLRAAGMVRAGDGEVHHVGRQHAVVDDVDALLEHAVDESRREGRR